MKILTLNINSHSRNFCREHLENKADVFAAFLLENQIDVAVLQECSQTKAGKAVKKEPFGSFVASCEQIPVNEDNCALWIAKRLEEAGAGYYWTWCGVKIGYDKYDEGLAIFCRYPIEETRVISTSLCREYSNWKTRKILGIKTRIGGQKYWFYSAHMGWWADKEEPFMVQMDQIENHLVPSKENIFLMGDFNSPDQVRGEGYDYVKRLGWQDTYELAKEKDAGYTVSGVIDGWEGEKPDDKRIDYIWVKKTLPVSSSRVIFSGKTEPVISDHFGVMAEMKERGDIL